MRRSSTVLLASIIACVVLVARPTSAQSHVGTRTDAVPGGDAVSRGGDIVAPIGADFVLQGEVWPGRDLTYGFQNWTADLSVGHQEAVIADAFGKWAEVSGLTFTEVRDCGMPFNDPRCRVPDIRILFGAGDHGSGPDYPDFDGPGGIKAHAFFPPVPGAESFTAFGDLHFDDDETWTTGGAGAADLGAVALHEIGHTIGLDHAQSSLCPLPPPAGHQRPIMCQTLYDNPQDLTADDIDAVQTLYGPNIPAALVVDIEAPDTVPVGRTATVPIVITNGLPTPVLRVSLDVVGYDPCDHPTIPAIGAFESVTRTCHIPTNTLLPPFTTATTLQLEARVTADGSPPVSDGPVSFAVVAPEHRFSDVPAWVASAVDWISHFQVATGNRDGTYRPDDPVKRSELTRMAYRLNGSVDVGRYPALPFSDVPAWVEDAVKWATHDADGSGGADPLMSGFPDATFRPNDSITRGAVVRLLYRIAGQPRIDQVPPHGLSDVPSWIEAAVRWAAHDPDGGGPLASVMAGFPDKTFRSNDPISRAQVTGALYHLAARLGL